MLGLLLLGVSCSKDDLDSRATRATDSHISVQSYDLGQHRPEEVLRIQISRAFAKALYSAPGLRNFVLSQLSGGKSSKIQEIPVLALLNQNFEGSSVADIVANYFEYSSQGLESRGGISGDLLMSLVSDNEDNMSLEFPSYVSGFIPMLYDSEGELDFSQVDIVFFGETTTTNAEGKFVGYSANRLDDSISMKGIGRGQAYEGYIPVHVKRSRKFIVVNQATKITTNGSNLSDWFIKTPPVSCLNEFYSKCVVDQDFLESTEDLIYIVGLQADVNVCINQGPTDCETNPMQCQELCNNGIDDDGDGLIDGADAACQGTEICNNGRDDDNDGKIDGQDEDCITCDLLVDRAYRDCHPDYNRLTGSRFNNLAIYSDILNPDLPSLEENVNPRFDFFNISNIQNCNPCDLTTYGQTFIGRAVAVFTDEGIENYNDRVQATYDLAVTEWNSNMVSYENFLDPHLNSRGVPAFFLVLVTTEDVQVRALPVGAIRIGSVGFGGRDYRGNAPWASPNSSRRDDPTVYGRVPLVAWLVYSNWVPLGERGIPYTPVSSTGEWDASILGSTIGMAVNETDTKSTTSTSSNSSGSEITKSREITVSAKFGVKIPGTQSAEISPTFGYSFANQTTKSATTTLSITAASINFLGEGQLQYSDSPNSEFYPLIRTRNPGIHASQVMPNTSWGYRFDAYGESGTFTNSRTGVSTTNRSLPFDHGSTENFQIINYGDISFTNLIRER